MDAKVILRIRTVIWVILLIMITVVIIYGKEIGSWITDTLTSGADSRLQQLLR